MNTPWGKSQTKTTIARGLHYVTTARHGGYMISKALAEKLLPHTILNQGFVGMPYKNYYCYEEDCAYAVLELYILRLPLLNPIAALLYKYIKSHRSERLNTELYAEVFDTVSHWYPNLLNIE